MEFFNKIKSKLKVKNFIWTIMFIVLACLFGFMAISNGFSSEMQWQIGVRGSNSGIPVPNWLISCFLLLMCIIFLGSAFLFLKSFIKNTEFNKMLHVVEGMGNAEAIGTMLASMDKNKYAKGGDLRYNESIIFYMKGTDVTVIPPATIRGIRTEIVGNKGSETNFVCVYYGKDVLKIKTSEKNVLLLLEEMRNTFA